MPTSSSGTNDVAASLLAKLDEQADRAMHLISRVPEGGVESRPLPSAMSVGELLGHLLECMAGFCAVLHALFPERLAHFEELRGLRVNHSCGADEALARMRDYSRHINEGFALIADADLSRRIPTVFSPGGETAMTLLLGNLEHLINHKHQLFIYLKLLGANVGTPDLYRLRS